MKEHNQEQIEQLLKKSLPKLGGKAGAGLRAGVSAARSVTESDADESNHVRLLLLYRRTSDL